MCVYLSVIDIMYIFIYSQLYILLVLICRHAHRHYVHTSPNTEEEDAYELFHMLDASHEGHIQADEFLNGCLRLDGPAKAIDLAAFMEESRKAGLPKTRAIEAKIRFSNQWNSCEVNRTFLAHVT